MGVYAGDTVLYLTETFNVAPDVQRYIGNALVRDSDDVKPSLDLDFANNKSLTDNVSRDNLITCEVIEFSSLSDASYHVRGDRGGVGNILKNIREETSKHAYGYTWNYIDAIDNQ